MAHFSQRSLDHLKTCDERLQRLFEKIVMYFDCTIIEGHRTHERQLELFQNKATRTMNSKHLATPSKAVDVAPYPIDWENLKRFYHFAGFVRAFALNYRIPIRWGGDWDSDNDLDDQKFNDLVHFELL